MTNLTDSKATIAVTAANGELGTAIIKALLKVHPAQQIVALARTPAKAKFLTEDYGIEVRSGDYDNAEQLEQSLQGVDKVLLVSGKESPELRIGQHRNVINGAKKAGVSKIVYTSVQGAEDGTAFSPVIQSNRQTEQDIKDSGLAFVIGRNGIYIEPDIEYLDHYIADGAIINCAGEGKCGYTTRDELAYAYSQLLAKDVHNGNTYNLHGEVITQAQLATYFSKLTGHQIVFKDMSVEDYRAERQGELGEFLGTIIAGIYQGIREGASDNPSDYQQAAGREHISWVDYFAKLNF